MRKKDLGIEFSKVVISVGILIPRKNQLELINTFKTIKDDFPSTGIVLLGPKSKHHINKKYTKKLENKLTEWGMNDRVLMPGMRHDVSDWMSVSDV
ncbi:MAG: glycosyltransferase, partial [Candidatus Paceibacteria bacterium]